MAFTNTAGGPECDYCGGSHETVPVENASGHKETIGAYCPHCGNWHDLGESDPEKIETHEAVPDDEPVTAVCLDCNGAFKIQV